MGIGSGLGHSTGFAAESTYGTYVAPNRWARVNSNMVKKTRATIDGGGMSAGLMAPLGSMRHETSQAGAGPIAMDVPHKGIGLLLQALMGGTVTPAQQAATTAYLAQFPLADPIGKFLTIQGAVPDTGGTARPYTAKGCKITAAEFSCGINDPLRVTFDVDAREVVEDQTLAAPSFTSTRNFHFAQMAVKLGTYNSEASIQGVRRVTVRIERASDTGRIYAGNGGLKSEPILNAFQMVTGSLEADYVAKADLADRYANHTSTALDLVFTGPNIESTYFETFRIRVPMFFLEGESPTAGGPDIVRTTYPFKAYLDGTNPLASIETISTDTAL